jgi:hypothetical protein
VPSIAETGLASHCTGLLDSPNFAAGMRPLPGSWTSQTFRKGGVVVIAVVGRIQSKRTAENGRFTLAYHTKSIILTTRQHAPAYECILAQRRSTLGRHDREKARPRNPDKACSPPRRPTKFSVYTVHFYTSTYSQPISFMALHNALQYSSRGALRLPCTKQKAKN